MKTSAAAALLLAFATQPVQADVPLDRYQHLKTHSDRFDNYIQGLGRGILVANEGLRNNGQQPLFCVPAHFLGDKYAMLRIIETEIARHQDSDDEEAAALTVEAIAVDAFRRAYPCEVSVSSR